MTDPNPRPRGGRRFAFRLAAVLGAAAFGAWFGQTIAGQPLMERLEVAQQARDSNPQEARDPNPGAPSDPGNGVLIRPTTQQRADGADPEHAEPRAISIEAIEVEAPVRSVGLQEDRSLEVPDDADEAGWWRGGSAPGEAGPAVIVAHVDSYEGPGAFFRLGELSAGDEVEVERADGTVVRWRVDRLEVHAKEDFPTDEVYGDTADPTLRLITCSGHFDRSERSYAENTIVYLDLVSEGSSLESSAR